MKACNQCGKCCIQYGADGLSATASEIAWWEAMRPDIYQYVRDGSIWMDPDSGQPLSRCPFLGQLHQQGKYTCAIYQDRPDDCRFYPTHIDEMVRDGCEMIEVKDFLDVKRAQKKLDILMADSRPAAE